MKILNESKYQTDKGETLISLEEGATKAFVFTNSADEGTLFQLAQAAEHAAILLRDRREAKEAAVA